MKKQFELIEDRYEGVMIESAQQHTPKEFENNLLELMESLQNKKLLWIKLSIENSEFIPLLTKNGFVFHHCNEKDITLVKRLIQNPIIPTAKNHTLGVGVVVLDGENLLVVKDRIHQTYKLPGGYIDDGENISDAVVREVLEETGVDVEFESVVSLGHFTPAQFGESNLYVVSLAKPLSTEIDIKDEEEIIEARWINVHEYLEREDVLPYNKALVKSALASEKRLKKEHEIELAIRATTKYELFF